MTKKSASRKPAESVKMVEDLRHVLRLELTPQIKKFNKAHQEANERLEEHAEGIQSLLLRLEQVEKRLDELAPEPKPPVELIGESHA